MRLAPRVTPPTDLPVSLEQVKAQSVIDFPDDDELLTSYIQSAVGHLDGPTGILGRAVMAQTVVQSFDGLSKHLRLPYGDVSTVTSVEYFDEDNTIQTLALGSVLRDGEGDFIYFSDDLPSTYNRPDAVTVTYTAGWADAESVPYAIKQSIKLLVAHWYENREATSSALRGGVLMDIPLGVSDMIAPFRRVGV